MKKMGITATFVIMLILVITTLNIAIPATAASGNTSTNAINANVNATRTPVGHPLPVAINRSSANSGRTFNQTHAINQSRMDNIYIILGKQRLSQYNSLLSKENSQISAMASKGFDVSGLQSVVAGAQSNVVTPLQNAVNTGNGTVVKDQLKSACLDNGMPYSYHYSAQINLARLTSINNKLATLVNNTTIQGQISDVNSKLSSVSSTLNSIGTSPYTGSQQDQVWDGLQAASQELKTIIIEINANRNK
jgi:Spy/CpxP family protein refolding chaperone